MCIIVYKIKPKSIMENKGKNLIFVAWNMFIYKIEI